MGFKSLSSIMNLKEKLGLVTGLLLPDGMAPRYSKDWGSTKKPDSTESELELLKDKVDRMLEENGKKKRKN